MVWAPRNRQRRSVSRYGGAMGMSRKGRCVLGKQARRPVGDDSAAIVPGNPATFAHVAVRGIGRAQRKRPRQISCANQLGNEANRRGQLGCPSYHQRGTYIFAPDRAGVKRIEKATEAVLRKEPGDAAK